jgi:hypothetical protein
VQNFGESLQCSRDDYWVSNFKASAFVSPWSNAIRSSSITSHLSSNGEVRILGKFQHSNVYKTCFGECAAIVWYKPILYFCAYCTLSGSHTTTFGRRTSRAGRTWLHLLVRSLVLLALTGRLIFSSDAITPYCRWKVPLPTILWTAAHWVSSTMYLTRMFCNCLYAVK